MRTVQEMKNEIDRAWAKAQAAWEAAGCVTPCYDEAYMAARKELSDAYARADREWKRDHPDRLCK